MKIHSLATHTPPQKHPWSSQQNGVAVFSKTADVDGDFFENVKEQQKKKKKTENSSITHPM